MAAKVICDGCGKEQPMVQGPGGRWLKPPDWFQRSDEDGIQVVCGRRCIDTVSERTGKPRFVLPS